MSTERERLIARGVIRVGGHTQRQTSPLPRRSSRVAIADVSDFSRQALAIIAIANYAIEKKLARHKERVPNLRLQKKRRRP